MRGDVRGFLEGFDEGRVVVYQSVVRLLTTWYVAAIGILIRKMGKNVSRSSDVIRAETFGSDDGDWVGLFWVLTGRCGQADHGVCHGLHCRKREYPPINPGSSSCVACLRLG